MIIHMRHRGFTIVELIIVITIMAILMTLGVVNMRSSQANGRDAERKTDIESIAQHLETYYTSGTDGSTDVGSYPSTTITGSLANIQLALRDIDPASFVAPGLPTDTANINASVTSTFIAATNAVQTAVGVTPQPTINQYVYQPLYLVGSTWTLCTDNAQLCRKFNLYYRQEVDNSVIMVTGKNQ
jgi:prepilin-type N-terminal cleavage/methylation domain-containing protein